MCAGIVWVMKRAQQVRQFIFGPFERQEDNHAAALSVIQAQSSWTTLRTLSFETLQGEFHDFTVGTEYAILIWVLGKASALEYLRLHCGNLQPLPSIRNLKHL